MHRRQVLKLDPTPAATGAFWLLALPFGRGTLRTRWLAEPIWFRVPIRFRALAHVSVLVALALLRGSPVRAESPPPQSAAPQSAAPQSAAPQSAAPQSATFRSAPLGPSPHDSAAEEGNADTTTDGEQTPTPTVRYALDAVQVRGNGKTSDRVILRFVPFIAGDSLNVNDPRLQLTRYRLLGTGFFRNVTLSLEKGKQRGHVVLVVDVVERNTIVVSDLWMGLSASADTRGEQQLLSPYAGLDAAETNLLGSGITLGGAAAFSKDQLAFAARFFDPAFADSPWMLSGEVLFNDALGFFGNSNVRWEDPRQVTEVPRQAVVTFKRLGSTLGVGRDLSVASQAWLNFRLEAIRAEPPRAASHEYGGVLEPLDFNILPGRSRLSTLRATFQTDTRDQPLLTRSGHLTTLHIESALEPLGSSYAFQQVDLSTSHWWPIASGQALKLEAFAGIIAGNAPFFEQYYIGDLTDFRPGRVLGLALDDRPAPDFFGTSIAEVRYGDYAAKLGAEYRIALYRGRRSIYGIDLFTSWGLVTLATSREIRNPPSDLSGFSRFPLDLTANIGFQVDTSVGGFNFSFANLLGFIPLREGE